jgi:hypothetical protein
MEHHANINMGSPQFFVPLFLPTCVDLVAITSCKVIDFGLKMLEDNLATPKAST